VVYFVVAGVSSRYLQLSNTQPEKSLGGMILRKLGLIAAAVFAFATMGMAQTTYSKIESMSGIASCSSCAGAGGSGSSAAYWMKQFQISPSMDGTATQFFLGGSTAYSDAMWTKKVSGSDNYHHFVFDTYYYVKNSSAVQGLEFNITDYANLKGYTFGFTCDVKASGTWKISVPKSSTSTMSQMYWQSTGISCPAPQAYTWNHFSFEGQRTSDNKVLLVSLTINGTKHYLNKTLYARICPSGWAGVTTHIQLNGDSNQDDYSVWADKWTVTLW
jgi:hypothetical protein